MYGAHYIARRHGHHTAGSGQAGEAAGRLDIAFMPSGTKGYEDLAGDAEKFEAFGVHFLAASLDDIIRSKEATGRARDEDDVVILRALKRRAK